MAQSTALITGANRGIGLRFVQHYLNQGWRVIAAARQPQKADELNELEGELDVVELDVCQQSHIERLQADLKGQPIDLLLNNAGMFDPGIEFGEANVEDWLPVMHTNCYAPLMLSHALIDNVKNSNNKTIACITSRMGSIADNTSGDRYYYRASKAALNSVIKSMALDLAHESVICLALHPGWVRTRMGGESAALSPEESVNRLTRIIDHATLDDSGRFLSHDGSELPF